MEFNLGIDHENKLRVNICTCTILGNQAQIKYAHIQYLEIEQKSSEVTDMNYSDKRQKVIN